MKLILDVVDDVPSLSIEAETPEEKRALKVLENDLLSAQYKLLQKYAHAHQKPVGPYNVCGAQADDTGVISMSIDLALGGAKPQYVR